MSLSTWPLVCASVLISASLTFAMAVVLRSTHGVYIASYVNMLLAAQRHQSLSDDVSRAFASAGIPATKAWSEAMANARMV